VNTSIYGLPLRSTSTIERGTCSAQTASTPTLLKSENRIVGRYVVQKGKVTMKRQPFFIFLNEVLAFLGSATELPSAFQFRFVNYVQVRCLDKYIHTGGESISEPGGIVPWRGCGLWCQTKEL
jgi:hypothetical protein